MRETLIYYWLLRSAAALDAHTAYMHLVSATETYKDDPETVRNWYRMVESTDYRLDAAQGRNKKVKPR